MAAAGSGCCGKVLRAAVRPAVALVCVTSWLNSFGLSQGLSPGVPAFASGASEHAVGSDRPQLGSSSTGVAAGRDDRPDGIGPDRDDQTYDSRAKAETQPPAPRQGPARIDKPSLNRPGRLLHVRLRQRVAGSPPFGDPQETAARVAQLAATGAYREASPLLSSLRRDSVAVARVQLAFLYCAGRLQEALAYCERSGLSSSEKARWLARLHYALGNYESCRDAARRAGLYEGPLRQLLEVRLAKPSERELRAVLDRLKPPETLSALVPYVVLAERCAAAELTELSALIRDRLLDLDQGVILLPELEAATGPSASAAGEDLWSRLCIGVWLTMRASAVVKGNSAGHGSRSGLLGVLAEQSDYASVRDLLRAAAAPEWYRRAHLFMQHPPADVRRRQVEFYLSADDRLPEELLLQPTAPLEAVHGRGAPGNQLDPPVPRSRTPVVTLQPPRARLEAEGSRAHELVIDAIRQRYPLAAFEVLDGLQRDVLTQEDRTALRLLRVVLGWRPEKSQAVLADPLVRARPALQVAFLYCVGEIGEARRAAARIPSREGRLFWTALLDYVAGQSPGPAGSDAITTAAVVLSNATRSDPHTALKRLEVLATSAASPVRVAEVAILVERLSNSGEVVPPETWPALVKAVRKHTYCDPQLEGPPGQWRRIRLNLRFDADQINRLAAGGDAAWANVLARVLLAWRTSRSLGKLLGVSEELQTVQERLAGPLLSMLAARTRYATVAEAARAVVRLDSSPNMLIRRMELSVATGLFPEDLLLDQIVSLYPATPASPEGSPTTQ